MNARPGMLRVSSNGIRKPQKVPVGQLAKTNVPVVLQLRKTDLQ